MQRGAICQTSLDIQETESGGPTVSKQRSIIHFSSGETLEEEDSEENEEQSSDRPPFTEPAKRVGHCLSEKCHVKCICHNSMSFVCSVSSILDKVLIQKCGHSSG